MSATTHKLLEGEGEGQGQLDYTGGVDIKGKVGDVDQGLAEFRRFETLGTWFGVWPAQGFGVWPAHGWFETLGTWFGVWPAQGWWEG